MYQIERVEIITEEAPHISKEDLISLSEAAELLGITVQAITGKMLRGELVAILDPSFITAYKRPRRYVLKKDIERLVRQGNKTQSPRKK